MVKDLKAIIGSEEKILYEGKPRKICYVFEGIFNPLLPIAVIWTAADALFFSIPFFSQTTEERIAFMQSPIMYIIIPFLLFHLMPLWIYLAGVISVALKYRNAYYIVTDKAMYASGGVIAHHIDTKPFAELSHIDLHRGIFDRIFNVGDIIATSDQFKSTGSNTSYGRFTSKRSTAASASVEFSSIANYTEVYKIIKKLQNDIYTDVQYPNAYRPAENPGYNTEYTGLGEK